MSVTLPRDLHSQRRDSLTGMGTEGQRHLDSCIGQRNYPSMPVDHAAAPEYSKIPDRVKLRGPRGQ